MKLVKSLSLLAAALGTAGVVALAVQGCSSSSDSGTSGGTTSTKGQPPGVPAGAKPSDTPARTFAINQLFLGETDRTGNGSVKDPWKAYGYNIDGLVTAKTDTNVCQRQGNADPAKQEDGNDGIDNSFGRTIISFIGGIAPAPSKTINTSIAGGSFTILLEIKGLTDEAKQTNTGLSGRLLIGGAYGEGKKPTFSPTDDWPFRASPIVNISDAYINNGTFVNGAGGAKIDLSLFIQGVELSLTINRAAITFDYNGAAAKNDVTNGTISGVIKTTDLLEGITKVAGRISTQLCGGSTLDTIKQTLTQASDILSDGSNKPGVPCDGISIGIGFTAKQIGPAKTPAKDVAPPPNPCDDAGAPADSGADSSG